MKIVLIYLLIAITLISCDNTTADGVGFVRLVAVADKSIDVIDSGRIERYEYTAEPLFENKEKIYGETDWLEVEANEKSSALIGPFTQGLWRFNLRALSLQGYVMWTGAGEGYIGASTDSVIPITMNRVDGTGYISFRLSVPEYTSDISSPVVKIDNADITPVWTETGRGTGTIEFSATVEGVQVGWHSVTVQVTAGGTTVGEAAAVEISNGNYSFIRGSFAIGEYVEAYLKLDAPEAARSEIRNADGTAITSDDMKKGESRTYTYALTSGRDTATVSWYINGEFQKSGKTYTFTPTATGVFEISALSRYYAESAMGEGWIEESTSSSITVYVEPKLSTITWNTGTYTTRQYVAYNTVLTLNAPTRDGYVFKNWTVTGSKTTTLKDTDTLTVEGSAYTLTAVWEQKPVLKLKATKVTDTKYSISQDTGSSTVVSEGDVLDVTLTGVTGLALRWFVDGKEVFWIIDKGDGKYTIPTKEEAQVTKGTYPVTVRGTKSTVEYEGSFNLTWQ